MTLGDATARLLRLPTVPTNYETKTHTVWISAAAAANCTGPVRAVGGGDGEGERFSCDVHDVHPYRAVRWRRRPTVCRTPTFSQCARRRPYGDYTVVSVCSVGIHTRRSSVFTPSVSSRFQTRSCESIDGYNNWIKTPFWSTTGPDRRSRTCNISVRVILLACDRTSREKRLRLSGTDPWLRFVSRSFCDVRLQDLRRVGVAQLNRERVVTSARAFVHLWPWCSGEWIFFSFIIIFYTIFYGPCWFVTLKKKKKS